jgi:hypothetical protein
LRRYSINIALLFFLAVFRLTGQDIESLLPAQVELQGWKISEGPAVYAEDQLFELINGGADIYLEYGFSRVVSVHYLDPSQNTIQLEIYEMSDDAAAYGIFSITQQAAAWTKDFGTISSFSEDYISFWKSRYYVNISWSSRQHIDQPLMAHLARLVAGKILETGEYPELISTFNADDGETKTLYLKGRLGLSNFYYFDYRDIFMISEGLARAREGYNELIFKYPDTETALEIAGSSKQSIANNKRFIDLANAFQGYSCKDNKGNRILVRQVENYLVVLVATDPEKMPAPEMDRISSEIENLTK